jgi:hypothetical protein
MLSMDLTVSIPDDLARRLAADGTDLSRRALEALNAFFDSYTMADLERERQELDRLGF